MCQFFFLLLLLIHCNYLLKASSSGGGGVTQQTNQCNRGLESEWKRIWEGMMGGERGRSAEWERCRLHFHCRGWILFGSVTFAVTGSVQPASHRPQATYTWVHACGRWVQPRKMLGYDLRGRHGARARTPERVRADRGWKGLQVRVVRRAYHKHLVFSTPSLRQLPFSPSSFSSSPSPRRWH